MAYTPTTINTSGYLINEDGPKNNPWELHYFKHNIDVTIGDDYYKIVEFKLTNIPRSLSLTYNTYHDQSVDKLTNIILEGLIEPLTLDQVGVVEEDLTPYDDIIQLDGSNWKNIGRYRYNTKQYDFYIELIYYRFKLKEGETATEFIDTGLTDDRTRPDFDMTQATLTSVKSELCNIIVVKNNDIDNYLFCKRYLESGHNFVIDGITYNEDNMDDFFNVHPGPFGF